MKQQLTALASLLICATSIFAQDFPGIRTSNFAGVNGALTNPACIAATPFRFDVNLASVNATIGNDRASFHLQDVFSGAFNADSVRTKLFGRNAGPSSGIVSVAALGPSFMFNLDKKSALAITTRARAIMNVRDMDGKLVDQVVNNPLDPASFPYTISSKENMQLSLNGWSEFGATYARVISDNDHAMFKAGATLKYLAGTANAYMSINQLNTTLNLDAFHNSAYFNNSTGSIGVGFGGQNLTDFKAADLTKFHGGGAGVEIGFTYELKEAKENVFGLHDRKLSFGVALLDIGSVKYQRDQQRSGSYGINVTGGEQLQINDIDTVNFDNYNRFFASRPQYFTAIPGSSDKSYKVALPATLQLTTDYHVVSGLYVNAAAHISLVGKNSNAWNSMYYNAFAITPRFETKRFSIFVPVTYNSLTKTNAGLTIRTGWLFIGSGSVLTALTGNSKQADVHAGVHIYRFHHAKKTS
jgi:Family of unknown function (DUF5723)